MSRLVTRLLVPLLALACLATALSTGSEVEEPALTPAADLSQWDPGNIISDRVFFDSGSMSAEQIKNFLQVKGADCQKTRTGPACIKDLVLTTSTRSADAYCNRYAGARESAAAVIRKVALACGISPRVLIVTLQKEQGIITQKTPDARIYSRAMGFGCPDNAGGACDSDYYGLFNQLYNAAKQFKRYTANPRGYGFFPGIRTIGFYPAGPRPGDYNYRNQDCGATQVNIRNQATANLYNYTPYQPNKNALAAGYGVANPKACAAYGNRNFYNYFTDWFGSTQIGGYDPDAPVGRLETVRNRGNSVLVRGWAYDPNAPTSAVRLGIIADGRKIGSDTTDISRPDVAEVNRGAGPNQGFEAKLPLRAGRHTVCVYAANIGAGKTAPRLGCATLSITNLSYFNPKGRTTDVRVAGTRVVIEGWAFDNDSPKSATTVRVYANGLRLGDLKATLDWPTVGKYYPSAGSAHGFRLTSRLMPGKHRVCAYGLNRGLGTENRTSLGCRTVTATGSPLTPPVTSGSPIGRVISFELDGQDLALTGWAFDPDEARKTARVQLLSDGDVLAEMVANRDWPDVQRSYPYAGSTHRFSWRGIVPGGEQRLCVRVVDVGAGSDKDLTCRSVTVTADPKANPIGGPRKAEVSGSTVRFAGWSFDPDLPAQPVKVRIYVGTTTLAEVVADGDWPDVGKYHGPTYPTVGNAHGFEWVGDLPPGEQRICVQAYNLRYGTADPTLGCMKVTIGAAASAAGVAEGTSSTAPADAAGTDTGAADTGTTDTGTTDSGTTDPGTTDPGTTGTGTTGTGTTDTGTTDAGTTDATDPDAGQPDTSAEPTP